MSFYESFTAALLAVIIGGFIILCLTKLKDIKTWVLRNVFRKRIPIDQLSNVMDGASSIYSPSCNPIELTCNDTKKKQDGEDEYMKLLKEFEDDGEKVIFIHHKLNTSSISLFENGQTLSLKDATELLDIIRTIPDDKNLSIIITTTGGALTAAEIITDALVNHKGRKRIYIPHYAFSAGTMITLAGNEIYLGKGASLGQVDPQFGTFGPCSSVISYAEKYLPKRDDGSSYGFFDAIVCYIHAQAIQARERVEKIVRKACNANNYTDDQYTNLYELLIKGKSNHDTPLFYNDLNGSVLQINEGIPEKISKLIELNSKKKQAGNGGLFGGLF